MSAVAISGGRERGMPPAVLSDLLDDLSVEVSQAMRRQRLRLCDLERFGYSETRIKEISRWLRGEPELFGIQAALRLADHLRVPVRFSVGADVGRRRAA